MAVFCKKIYTYRWYIGMVLWALCVLMEIHGSSIGLYSNLFHEPDTNTVLFGKNRPIRTDEWVVNTPLAFSQYFNNFSYFSQIVRGGLTDMFIVYGQPILSPATLFHPFLLGYLFLSPAKGLAFFWMGRWILLFLVSFEFGMLIARQNKKCALIYGVSIALSPLVQWWFAVNGIAEILIFGQAGILLLRAYLKETSYVWRMVLGGGVTFALGSYIFVAYPAWQVTCGYVFLAVMIWMLWEERQKFSLSWMDGVIAFAAIAVIAWIGMLVWSNSAETIKTIRQTIYPGSRFCLTAGLPFLTFVQYALNYAVDLLLPVRDLSVLNSCEAARMFDLFPLGILLAAGYCWKNRRFDGLLRNLLLAQCLFLAWCFFTWPAWFAKFSLLSNVTPRILLGIGMINLMLLVRTLALWQFSLEKRKAYLGAFVFASGSAFLACISDPGVMHIKYGVIFLLILYPLFYWGLRRDLKKFTAAILIVLIYAGGGVNPIARGTASIYKHDVMDKILEITAKNQDLWLVVSDVTFNNDIPIMGGAPTINSVNIYPDLQRWGKLDISGKNHDIYNRYAHITVQLTQGETVFSLKAPDSFVVNLNIDDLSILNVRYIYTDKNLDGLHGQKVRLVKEIEKNGISIYQVNFVNQ